MALLPPQVLCPWSSTHQLSFLLNGLGCKLFVPRLSKLLHAVPARKLDASGPVILLSVQSDAPYQHLLVLHQGSGAAVWDLRAQILVTRVRSDAGQMTAAEWLHGSSRGDFATGHANGDINVWSLVDRSSSSGGGGVFSTSSSSGGGGSNWQDADKTKLTQQLLHPQLLAQLRVTASGCPVQQRVSSPRRGRAQRQPLCTESGRHKCRPVQSLHYVSMGNAEGLLVFGGGEEGQPDGLLLLPLPEQNMVGVSCCSIA